MDVVLFVTFSLGLCVWLLLFAFFNPRWCLSVMCFSPQRIQKGRRSVCDFFSCFLFVVVAVGFFKTLVVVFVLCVFTSDKFL